MYNGSANDFNTSHMIKFNALDLKLSELFIDAGHKKEDMIVGYVIICIVAAVQQSLKFNKVDIISFKTNTG